MPFIALIYMKNNKHPIGREKRDREKERKETKKTHMTIKYPASIRPPDIIANAPLIQGLVAEQHPNCVCIQDFGRH